MQFQNEMRGGLLTVVGIEQNIGSESGVWGQSRQYLSLGLAPSQRGF
jgi:hypothetical protein